MGAPLKHTAVLGRRLTGIVAAIATTTLFGVVVAGCGGVRGGSSGYRLTSIQSQATLAPSLKHGWFHAADENSADLYLTDLSPETLTSQQALATASGNIVHVRMLLRPRAGRTPIEPTALSAAVVHVVLADGQIGVYQGGGFMQPSGSTAERTFGGSIRGGSMHLGAATPGFVDRLGAAQLTAGFRAERNPDRLREIRGALAWALSVAPPVIQEPPPAPPEPEPGS